MTILRIVFVGFGLTVAACGQNTFTDGLGPLVDDGGADNLLGPDGSAHRSEDMAHRPGAPGQDLAVPPPGTDMATQPVPNTGVGPHGGSVTLLHFGVSGDTRPPSCEDTQGYPTMVINGIANQFKTRNAQFAIDLGDHMYVCNDDLSTALAQMSLFMKAVHLYGATWFLTEGNHECWKGPCLAGSQNANYVAFMQALAPIAQRPYYSFSVNTSHGLATFVVVADNSWDNLQAAWLDQTLAAADANAKYTIVARHHPEGDTSVATNQDIMTIIRNHKFALFLAGHDHLYKHMKTDNGRDLVLGNSGAPLIAGGTFYGYGVVDQLDDGRLQVTVWDLTNNAPVDSWAVGPNQ